MSFNSTCFRDGSTDLRCLHPVFNPDKPFEQDDAAISSIYFGTLGSSSLCAWQQTKRDFSVCRQ